MQISIKKLSILLVAFIGVLVLILVVASGVGESDEKIVSQQSLVIEPEQSQLSRSDQDVHMKGIYSLVIPSELEEVPYGGISDDVLWLRKAGSPLPELGTDGEPTIRVSVDENPNNLSVTEYYDGDPGTAFFEQSNNEFKLLSVAGKQAYEFVPYVTMAGDVMVVVPLEKKFLVVHDFGAAYQNNGIFQKLLDSIKFDESNDFSQDLPPDPGEAGKVIVEDVYSLVIPQGLEKIEYGENKDNQLIFHKIGLPLPKPATDWEVLITISVDENPNDLSVTEYYDGDPGSNIFGESEEEYESISVAGKYAYKFVPSESLTGDIFVIIPLKKKFLTIHDSGASYHGELLQKVLDSLKFDITVSSSANLPPDPGEAGKATVEGIDSNGNGVRDDVERWIVFTYGASAKVQAGLTQKARAWQQMLLAGHSQNGRAIEAAREQAWRASLCLQYILPGGADLPAQEEMEVRFLDTQLRTNAFLQYNRYFAGKVLPVRTNVSKTECMGFDPDALPN